MICDRCSKATAMIIMSMFNTQDICAECKEKEQKHPKYRNAVEAERKAVLNGIYSFPGIGLPEDLNESNSD